MDIKQLKYFTEIVNCDCSLSLAANKIHISQPALSKMIKQFEKQEDVILFKRFQGKLNKLTPEGRLLYEHAKKIIHQYDLMYQDLKINQQSLSGEINIGIPPFMISTIFSKVVGKLKSETPKLQLNIFETGGEILKKELKKNDVDIAILLKPNDLPKSEVEEVLLVDNELCVFMDQTHPLSIHDPLTWKHLNGVPIAMYNDNFMIHHYLAKKFKEQNIHLNIALESGYWDFLLRSTIDTNIVTILPALTVDYFPNYNLKVKPFNSPTKWQVVMVRNKKNTYSKVESYMFNKIKEHFEELNQD